MCYHTNFSSNHRRHNAEIGAAHFHSKEDSMSAQTWVPADEEDEDEEDSDEEDEDLDDDEEEE